MGRFMLTWVYFIARGYFTTPPSIPSHAISFVSIDLYIRYCIWTKTSWSCEVITEQSMQWLVVVFHKDILVAILQMMNRSFMIISGRCILWRPHKDQPTQPAIIRWMVVICINQLICIEDVIDHWLDRWSFFSLRVGWWMVAFLCPWSCRMPRWGSKSVDASRQDEQTNLIWKKVSRQDEGSNSTWQKLAIVHCERHPCAMADK